MRKSRNPDQGGCRENSEGSHFAVIVDCALYQDGKRLEGDRTLAEAHDHAVATPGAFVWIGLFEPTFEEFEDVQAVLGLHPLAVEDAVHAHQRPKIEQFDDTQFIVLITARYVDTNEVVELGEVMLFLAEHFVVSVRHGQAATLGEARRHLESDPERLAWGPAAVLHTVMDRVVDQYEEVLTGIDNDVDEIESQVFAGGRHNHAERIFRLKREVLDFRKGVRPLVEPLERYAERLDDEMKAYYRDVHDHLARVNEHLDTYDGILVSALNANLAQVGVTQNEDMRKMAAFAGMLALPTMIAGIYGMNFEHMPELTWTWGYPLSLALMGGLVLLLWRSFKKRGWL
jgi:magnesium transporter